MPPLETVLALLDCLLNARPNDSPHQNNVVELGQEGATAPKCTNSLFCVYTHPMFLDEHLLDSPEVTEFCLLMAHDAKRMVP